jgi:hypothetical protein
MGTVLNRATNDNPNRYVDYRENGRWVHKASRQRTKALAKRWVSEIESRIARGQVGIDHDVRRSFSSKLRAGLGFVAQSRGGRVAPMKRSRGATP